MEAVSSANPAVANASQFSLRQTLFAIAGLAVGFSIWRLPQGQWIDIPCATLGFYFVAALLQQAISVRRELAGRTSLSRPQKCGGLLLLAIVVSLALTLSVAWGLRAVQANQPAGELSSPGWSGLEFIDRPALPRDLAALTMLVAVGLNTWQRPRPARNVRREKLYLLVAVAVAALGSLKYALDHTFIPYLVYVAVTGVELAEAPRFLPPGLSANTALRQQRFAIAGFAGLAIMALNLLLLTALIRYWKKRTSRWPLLACLAAGIASEYWIAHWLVTFGAWQLSPPMAEAVSVPALAGLVVAATVVLASAAFSWRILARPVIIDPAIPMPDRREFLHETWLGGLLLGLCATVTLSGQVTATLSNLVTYSSTKVVDAETLLYAFTQHPLNFLWLAAAIGGFALAAIRRRDRKRLRCDPLPEIEIGQFATLMLSLVTVVIAGAPILTAAGFSLWLVRFPKPH